MVHLFQFPQHEVTRSIQGYLPRVGCLSIEGSPLVFCQIVLITCQNLFILLSGEALPEGSWQDTTLTVGVVSCQEPSTMTLVQKPS